MDWFKENSARFTGQILWEEPLSRHTYYRIGGPAKLLVIPKTIEDLNWIKEGLRASGLEHFILGAGSNLLVSDLGFDGVVIKAGRINLDIALSEHGTLVTGGSVSVSTLLRRASQEGWGGLEFLTGVPGTVGGAVVMNAGTHLGETKDRLIAVHAIRLEENSVRSHPSGRGKPSDVERFKSDQLRFEYRKNLFLPKDAVVFCAEWKIDQSEPAVVKALIDQTLARRKSTQPVDYPSCGSVFKNPKQSGLHAWQVIDRLGLRGHRIGDAQFAEKHSNFIINLDKAKASDVFQLIQLAKSRAKAELSIELEEEVISLGSF